MTRKFFHFDGIELRLAYKRMEEANSHFVYKTLIRHVPTFVNPGRLKDATNISIFGAVLEGERW